MRNLLTILVLVLLGCSSALAQQMQTRSPRNAPASTMGMGMSAQSAPGTLNIMPVPGLGAPGTIAAPTAALGTISAMPNTGATIARAPIGTITPCGGAPSLSLDASTALVTGTIAPPPLPGATIPPNPPFGSSLATGTCNPATGTQNAIEAFGLAAVIAPTPGLAIISGPSYGDATVPLTMTEAGASGMSPLIDIPSPCSSTAIPMTNPTMTTSATMPISPSTVMTTPPSTLTPAPPGC